jgi:ubiquitin-protein ligase
MTTTSEQLAAIFQEIKTSFSQHQQIQITPIAGSPPDKYRVIYNLQGLSAKTGNEVESRREHIITITLPFGFPHFPPNCKPESPVFHPDFDQAAICIGDFWEENPSLPGLIIHIGRMLCGEIFSTENAFNEDAAVWYQENQNKLPMDTIHTSSTSHSHLVSPGEQTVQSSVPRILDTIDDTFFLEDTIKEENDKKTHEQIERLPRLSGSVNRSRSILQSPADNFKLENTNSQPLNAAHQKYQEGQKHELQGQPARALAQYQTVKKIAPDFPNIENDISRILNTMKMLSGFAEIDSASESVSNIKNKTAQLPKTNLAQPEKKPLLQRPIILIVAGSALFFLPILLAFFYLNTQLKEANTLFKECRQLADTDQFTDAEKKCASALQSTHNIFLIKQQEKNLLIEEINQFQNSNKFREGLTAGAGRTSNILTDWQKALDTANKHLADANWKEALDGYTHALKIAANIPAIDSAVLTQVRNNLAIAEYNIAQQAGETALAAKEWDSAKKHLDKALYFARKNPQTPPAVFSKIQSLMGQIEFNTFVASGEEFLSKEEWAFALQAFEQAQKKEQLFSLTDTSAHASLQENIVRARVFNALEQGKKASADNQWDQAISEYETANNLLKENREILNHDNLQQSQHKIIKLILNAEIIKERQRADFHMKNKEFAPAIDKLQMIIKTINTSSFASEPEFQTIINETKTSLNIAQGDLLIAEQASYLTNNYQKFFILNNPTLIPEKLVNPRTTYLQKIDNKLLFKIQCSEEGHGRPVLLQTHYLYDPTTKQWVFYNNDQLTNEQKSEKTGQQILSSAYQAQENRLIAEQIAYLTENFQTLFMQNNPTLLRAEISKPQATFLKKIGEKMLFMLQGVHQESGKSTLLKIHYLYDPATNQWELSQQK